MSDGSHAHRVLVLQALLLLRYIVHPSENRDGRGLFSTWHLGPSDSPYRQNKSTRRQIATQGLQVVSRCEHTQCEFQRYSEGSCLR